MTTDTIGQFIGLLIEEAGLDGGDEERLQEYRERVTALVNQHLGIEMMKWLSSEDTEALLDSIDREVEPTSEEFHQFFSDHVEHFEDKVVTALLQFKQNFSEVLASVEDEEKAEE